MILNQRYYHELFIRGRLDLCRRMVRTRVKGNGSKAASSPSTEPNFYAMPPCTGTEVSYHENSSRKSSGAGMEQDMRSEVAMMGGDISEGGTVLDSFPKEDEAESDGLAAMVMSEPLCPVTPSSADEEETGPCTTTPQTSPIVGPSTPIFNLPVPTRPFSFANPSVVTPPSEPKMLVTTPSCPKVLASLSIPEEQEHDSPSHSVAQLERIHSGDQVFFEGLPFHYLETKDVEDNLLMGH